MTTIVTLVPEQLWQAIQPCSPPHHPATAAGPVSMTALRWPASSISCAPASPGGCCPLASSAVVAGHLLAAAVRLATRRRLAASAPGAVGPARPRWPARLVPRQRGFSERACQTGGELTGPNPTDRGKPGSSATCWSTVVAFRWLPACVLPTLTLHAAGGRGRRRPTDQREARPARSLAQAARQAPLRQGVRLPALPVGAAPTGDHAQDRSPWYRPEPAAWRRSEERRVGKE